MIEGEVQVQSGGDAILSSDERLLSLISKEMERRIVVVFLFKCLWWAVFDRVILTWWDTQNYTEELYFKGRSTESVFLVFSVYITDSLQRRLYCGSSHPRAEKEGKQ